MTRKNTNMQYESANWIIEVPQGWGCYLSDDCTTFEKERDAIGAFQVSSYCKDDVVTDDELREFAGEVPLVAISTENYSGFRTRFSEDDIFWTKWWLRAGNQMIHATYNCLIDDRGREDEQIAQLIQSLAPS